MYRSLFRVHSHHGCLSALKKWYKAIISEYSWWFWDWISATQTVCPHTNSLKCYRSTFSTTETWKLPAPMPPDSANSNANISLTALFTFYPESDINFCLEFHRKSSKSCWDISLKTTNLNSTVVLKGKKSYHECWDHSACISWQDYQPHSQTLALECTDRNSTPSLFSLTVH